MQAMGVFKKNSCTDDKQCIWIILRIKSLKSALNIEVLLIFFHPPKILFFPFVRVNPIYDS